MKEIEKRNQLQITNSTKIVCLFIYGLLIVSCSIDANYQYNYEYYPDSKDVRDWVFESSDFKMEISFAMDKQVVYSVVNCHTKGTNVLTSFHEGGSIAGISSYRDEKLHGPYVEFYTNNSIAYVANYKEGLLWDIMEMYDSAGNRLDKGSLKNGSGVAKFYTPGGRPERWGECKTGLKEGYWKYRTNTGHVDSTLYVASEEKRF